MRYGLSASDCRPVWKNSSPTRPRPSASQMTSSPAEWRVPVRGGVARLFVNGENLTGVRQTRYDPLLLPRRGPGGRWTTDVWTELAGAPLNGGVRLEL